MSTPHALSLMADLFSALRTNLGTYDLSDSGGTHRVSYADAGLASLPTLPPWILLSAPVTRATFDQAALGTYQVTGQLEWWAWAPSTATDVATRIGAAVQLAHEMIVAIENAYASPSFATLYGSTPQLLCEVLDVFGDGPELGGGVPFTHGRITYQTFPTRGI